MPKNTAIPIALAHLRAGAAGDDQRQDAQDEREGRHQDRTEPQPCSLHDRLHRPLALGLQLAGELDDQDRILGGQADENDEADLRQDVDVSTQHRTPAIAASRHIGTISTIASGRLQLAYCAASTR